MRNFLQILKNIKVSKSQSLMGIFETARLNFVNFVNFVMAKFNILVVDSHDETSTYPRVLSRIAPVKYTLCLVLMLMMGSVSAWGRSGYAYAWPNTNSTTKYSLNAGTIPCGVYVDMKETTPSDYYQYDYASQNVGGTRHFYAKAGDGYYFIGWYSNSSYSSNRQLSTSTHYSNGDGIGSLTVYAKFGAVTVESVKSNTASSAISVTNTSPQNVTVVFNVDHADAVNDFDFSVTGEGWSLTSTKTYTAGTGTKGTITVGLTYTATNATTQGAHNGSVTLTSKGYNTGKSTGTRSSQTANLYANVDLTPSLTADPTSLDFGVFTVGVDSKKSKTVALTFNANAISFSKTADADITPFSATLSSDKKTLTVYYEPTSVGTGSWSNSITVTAKNGQATQLSASQTITLTGQAQSITNPTYTCNIEDSYMVSNVQTIDLQTLWTSNSNGNITYSIEKYTEHGENNGDGVKPAITDNRYLSTGRASEIKLKLTQESATNFYAGNAEKTITINKYTTSIAPEANYSKQVEQTQTIADYNPQYVTAEQPALGATNHEFYYTIEHTLPANAVVAGSAHPTEVIGYDPSTHTITAYNAGTAVLKIAQKQTYNYTGDTVTYNVTVTKYATSFTGSAYNLMVDGVQTADYSWTNTSAAQPTASSNDDFYYTIDNVSFTNSAKNKGTDLVTFNPSNNKITACNAGTAKITLHQKETYKYTGATQSFNVAVYKYNSVFSGQATLNTTVEASPVTSGYVLTYTKPDNAYIGDANHTAGTPALNSGNWYYTLGHNITTANQVGCPNEYQDVVISYNAENKQATGRNQGAATVSLYQVETYKYNSASTSFNVNVAKNANALSCSWGSWSKDMNVDAQTGVTFSANNAQTPIVIEQTSGDDEGNVIATYSSANNKITSIYNIGTATWSVSQAENYKYAAAETKTLTVNVKKASQPTCYVVDHASEQSVYSMWGQGDEYCEAIALDGIGESLVSFEAKKDGGTGDVSVVQYSKDNGQNWTTLRYEFGISSDFQKFGPFSFPALSNGERITHIRFGVSGTTSMISYRYKNIKVSRKKWFKLKDKDGNEISSLEMPTNTLGGNHTTATFTVDYSTCADQIKVVSNHPHITVSPASFTSDGAGTKEITVTYACDDPESIDGVITVYTPYENKTINVHAATEKKSQQIEWTDLFADETVSLPQTFTSNDAASATSKLPVKYNSGDPEIIAIAGDSLSFTIVGTGTTTLTATQAGNDEWKSVSDSKTINASNKKIQRIVWNQQFTRSLSVDNEIPLTARVYVMNVAEGTETESPARTEEIVYTCPDANDVIEILNGTNNIHVLGYGNTTITASVAGNEEYEAAASVTLPVRVREIQTGDCDMPLVFEQASEIEFFQSNLDEIIGSPIAIDHANGTPDKLSFDVRGAAWKLGIEYFGGSIQVQQSTDNKLSWSSALATVSPAKNSTASSGEVQLDPNVTHIRFVRPSGGRGYHYVGNIQITRLPYITTEEAAINLGNVSVGENREFTIPVSYANVKGNMNVTRLYDDNGLTVESAIEAECGDMASYNLQASVLPQSVGPWTNTVTVQDPLSGMFANIVINATIQKGSQTITWNPTLDILTTETPTLNAVASSGLTVSYAVTSGNNTVARIENGQVIILQPGTFAITASQNGNVNYNEAPNVVKEFTVTAETLTLLEGPTATDLTYGQTLSASTLTGGSVEDSKHNPVAGTFVWQVSSTAPNAGDNQSFEVVFVPSSNPTWYSTLQTTASLNVAQASPTGSQASLYADNIVYGQRLDEAVLHNHGSLDGTWTWANEDANKEIKPVGTYPRLNVHFKPSNPNYLEVDGTVIVTVVPAQPTGYSATASSIMVGQTVSNSTITNTGIAGEWEWVSPTASYSVANTYDVAAIFTPENTNYKPVETTLPLTVNPQNYTFTGSGSWDDSDNWNTHVVPTEPQDVIVAGNVIINDSVEVKSLTIEAGAEVTLAINGQLTVGSGNSEYRENYGNLHVEEGGHVILNNGTLKVNDFILDASLAGLTDVNNPLSNQAAKSGQVTNADKIDKHGQAYFDLSFDPSGSISYGWYDFTVPFEVNISGGISRINSTSNKIMVSGADFIIMEADEANRAAGGKGWRTLNGGVLQPGKLYTITLDDEVDQNTLRFTWNGQDNLMNGESYEVIYATGADANLNGWNGLGNGMLRHGYPDGSYKMQAYNHGTNTYDLVIGNKTFAVGSAFFIQVDAAGSVDWIPSAATSERPLYAPQREVRTVDEFLLTLTPTDTEYVVDALYVSASEDATTEYTIGHDLVKMGNPTESKVAKIWSPMGNLNLCDIELPLTNNNASFPLMFYAPQAGSYDLNIAESPEDATLFLTYDGRIIWNLSMSAYPLELQKGTTQGYGLRLVADRQTTTDFEQTGVTMQGVKKVLIDNQLYLIMPDGAIYTAEGKKVNE